MTKFISYAQNFEDVMLHRALKEVECGFYIDVGANDPTVDSVTRAFYDRGWRGINIEPILAWHQKIQTERPRDINLCIAAGAEKGQLQLFDFPGTGLATPDLAIAQLHQKEHHENYEAITVPVQTLNEVCTTYHIAPIHFLKIDVEGFELPVLQGIDLEVIRPWIIVVEATRPNSPEQDFTAWEPILLSARYRFVYFDGLNRFYLAEEKAQLENCFRTPPNFFDEFILYREYQAQDCLARTVDQAQRAEQMIHALESRVNHEVARVAEEANKVAELESRVNHEEANKVAELESRVNHEVARVAEEANKAAELESRVNHEVARVAELDQSRNQINQRLLESEVRLRDVQQNLDFTQAELAVIYRSLSWRMTVPVRWLGLQLRLLKRHGWRGRLDHLSQRLLGGVEPPIAEVTTLAADPERELTPLASRILRQIGLATANQNHGTQ